MTPGIHLFHTPIGPTSFSLVRECMESLRQEGRGRVAVCHGGTLDPFASGLLLMLVEPATKLFDYLHDIPKVYEATIRWGIETDNGDLLGKTIFESDAAGLTEARLEEALGDFIGWREQVPPATSARRIDGERAYLKAHRGEAVEMPAGRAYLHEARWIGHDLPLRSRLRVVVRGGYYVRALARDLGRRMGCGGHLTELWRAAIGPWADPGEGRGAEVHGREIMPWLGRRELTDEEVGKLRGGEAIAGGGLLEGDWKLPEGFPEGGAFVRGFHRGKMVFLLRMGEGLGVEREMRRGV